MEQKERPDYGYDAPLPEADRDLENPAEAVPAQNAPVENQADDLQLKLAIVVKKYNDLAEKARRLNELLQAEQRHSQGLQQQVDDLEDKLIYSKEVVNTVQVDLDSREEAYRKCQQENDTLKMIIEDQRKKLSARERSDQEFEDLRTRNTNLERELDQLRQGRDEVERRHQVELDGVRQEKEQALRDKAAAQEETQVVQAKLVVAQQELNHYSENLDKAREEALAVKNQAELDAARILEDARQRAQAEAILARREIADFRKNMVKDTRSMVVGLAVLQERIKNVDAMVAQVNREMDKCTGALYQAVESTQEDLAALGSEMLQVSSPSREQSSAPKKENPDPLAAYLPGGAAAAPAEESKASSLLADLLRDLNKRLDQH